MTAPPSLTTGLSKSFWRQRLASGSCTVGAGKGLARPRVQFDGGVAAALHRAHERRGERHVSRVFGVVLGQHPREREVDGGDVLALGERVEKRGGVGVERSHAAGASCARGAKMSASSASTSARGGRTTWKPVSASGAGSVIPRRNA